MIENFQKITTISILRILFSVKNYKSRPGDLCQDYGKTRMWTLTPTFYLQRVSSFLSNVTRQDPSSGGRPEQRTVLVQVQSTFSDLYLTVYTGDSHHRYLSIQVRTVFFALGVVPLKKKKKNRLFINSFSFTVNLQQTVSGHNNSAMMLVWRVHL